MLACLSWRTCSRVAADNADPQATQAQARMEGQEVAQQHAHHPEALQKQKAQKKPGKWRGATPIRSGLWLNTCYFHQATCKFSASPSVTHPQHFSTQPLLLLLFLYNYWPFVTEWQPSNSALNSLPLLLWLTNTLVTISVSCLPQPRSTPCVEPSTPSDTCQARQRL